MDDALKYVSRRVAVRSIALAIASIVATGCRKQSGSQEGDTASTTGAAASQSVGRVPSGLAVQLPTETRLLIDGHALSFPPPRIQVQGTSPLSLAIYSDKGPEAGSSYFIEVTLDDVDDLTGLDGASWQLMHPEERADDLQTAIRIDGGAEQLQPQEVSVSFSFDGKMLIATLTGRWGDFTRADAVVPERAVLVTGTLMAELKPE